MVLVLVIGMVWFGVILQSGPLVIYGWDQWFHIAHAREALESNRIVPSNPLWPDVPLSETYGAWHPLLAVVTRTAGVDMLVTWRVGNALMAGLSALVWYAVVIWIVGDPFISLVAAVVFLATGVGAQQMMRTFIYPWGMTYFCMWMGIGLFFRYLKTGERSWMLSAAALGLAPIASHPQEFIFFCFSVFALGASALLLKVFSERDLFDIKKIGLFLLALVVIGLPLVLIKYPTRATLNLPGLEATDPLEAELRLYPHPLARWLAVVFPYFGRANALFVNLKSFNLASLILLYFLPKHLNPKVRWLLITLTCFPLLFAVVPGFSWLATLVLRETYAWRLLNLVPTPLIWALVIVNWLRIKKNAGVSSDAGRRGLSKQWYWVYVGLAIGLIGVLGFAIILTVRQDNLKPAEWNESPLEHRAMFEQLDSVSSVPATVLSDPSTSYAIPALTKHRVVLNAPTHGTRDDIVTRFTETRALLSSPSQSTEEAWAILQRYGVDFILVRKDWLNRVFFPMIPFYSEYTLHFLRNNPVCFNLVYSSTASELFEVLDCKSTDIDEKGKQREDRFSLQDVEYVVEKRFSDNLTLLGFSLPEGKSNLSSERVRIDIHWRAEKRLEEPYFVILELLADYPRHALPYGRLFRRVRERIKGVKYKTAGVSWMSPPPTGYNSGETFVQSFTLEIPAHFSEGPYDLSLYILTREQALREQRVLPTYFMELEYIYPGIQLKRLRDRH